MILILGGTTEGRNCVQVLDEAGKPFYYATKGDEQVLTSKHGIRLTGGMDAEEIYRFCKEKDIRLLVDAAHPFAMGLHTHVAIVAERLQLPVVRYERRFPQPASSTILCSDYADAISKLEAAGIDRLLALTGVNTLKPLRPFWEKHTTYFRILDRETSFAQAASLHFPDQQLLTYDAEASIGSLLTTYKPQAVLSKESGESGGYVAKEAACIEAGIPFYVVCRPVLPANFHRVTGPHGLRRAIEKDVPGFFALRSGFTTGSCATAASVAALHALLGHNFPTAVWFQLPNEEWMSMVIDRITLGQGWAEATVTKDAGDDPDVTHRQQICSRIAFAPHGEIRFLQGEGVGTVTLPGLGLPIGGPAINRVPRLMMQRNLSLLYSGGIDITLSVPRGKELARKTFNPKLGIEGGISILGTLGIVRPFSSEAFSESIQREMEVAIALGTNTIVLNSGAKSERMVKNRFPNLPSQAFIHYGNLIGAALQAATRLEVAHVGLGIMLGKAVKLAAGHLNTHSKEVVLDKSFLSSLAYEAGCSDETQTAIAQLTLARELWDSLSIADARLFFQVLMQACRKHCRQVYPSGQLTLLLIHEDGLCFTDGIIDA